MKWIILLGIVMMLTGWWGVIVMVKEWRKVLRSTNDEQSARWTLKARNILLGSILMIVVGTTLVVIYG